MRILTISDLHVDYPENFAWVMGLSDQEFQGDILIIAGDISDDLKLLRDVLATLAKIFLEVLFVPGNHELWIKQNDFESSLDKFRAVKELCEEVGVHLTPLHLGKLSIVPLFSWYDFSFGEPDRYLRRAWRDFRACQWPAHLNTPESISDYFLDLNEPHLDLQNEMLISFSHFLPRIDVMPQSIPEKRRKVYPVLGSRKLGRQIERLRPDLHIYGHSHVNQDKIIDGISYINNAFAYPSEERIARKALHCVHEVR